MGVDELMRSRGRPVPPAKKLYLAAAKSWMARWVEGDCHTLAATKSLNPAPAGFAVVVVVFVDPGNPSQGHPAVVAEKGRRRVSATNCFGLAARRFVVVKMPRKAAHLIPLYR